MTAERDPLLESVFTRATQDLAPDDFADRVMLRIDRSRRRSIVGWAMVGLAAVACAWILSGSLLQAVYLGMQILPESLFEFESQPIARLFAPLNSVAGAVGLGMLGLWTGYRRIFR